MRPYLLNTVAAAAMALTLAADVATARDAELLHAWTRMDWAFPTEVQRAAFDDGAVYAQAPLHGVEGDRAGNIYVSTPRILDPRVPATFNRVVVRDGRSVLEPWPDWQTHDLANPDGLRNVLGAYVDARNRVWMLDMGFVGGETEAPAGGQKLVVFDLDTGQEIHRFDIGPELANPATSFLNDLVVDAAGETVYISETGIRGGSPTPSGIIVLDIATGAARRVLDAHPSVQDDPERPLVVNGEDVFPGDPLAAGINGITLSPDGATLYWSLTTGDALYAIETALLRDAVLDSAPADTPDDAELADAIEGPFRLGGGSDGIAPGPDGRIWVTDLTNNRVSAFDPETQTFETVVAGEAFIWPDSLAHDFDGGMLLSTNHLNHAFGGVMDFDRAEPNFRIFRIRNRPHVTQ